MVFANRSTLALISRIVNSPRWMLRKRSYLNNYTYSNLFTTPSVSHVNQTSLSFTVMTFSPCTSRETSYFFHIISTWKKAFWSQRSLHHFVKQLQGYQHHVLQLLVSVMTALYYSHSGIMHNASIISSMQLCAWKINHAEYPFLQK